MTGPINNQIQQKISARLNPTLLKITDDSWKHQGHAAMKGLKPVESHFYVEVVSQEFAGKTLIQRHRLIYEILGDELKSQIHALQLKTKTPEELNKN